MSKPDFKSPAFQFYPNDFLGSAKVAAMSLEEVGLYTLLLCYDWNEVGLPESPEVLAKLLRISPRTFKKLWRTVGENFSKRGNRYYNKRLDAERRKQLERKQKAADAANQRWHPTEDADALPDAMLEQSPSFAVASPTPIAITPPPSGGAEKGRPETALPDSVMDWCKRQDKPVGWIASLLGMLKGVGAPGGKTVTMEHIAEACSVADRLKGDCTPARFNRILVRVMEPEYKSTAHASSDDAEFVRASKRLRHIASFHDPMRPKSLTAEGWKIVTPEEREALKNIGSVERVLTAKAEHWGLVVRDFLKAQRGAAA